ncbi:MAG: hypothetical protein IPM25_01380 [Chloracidobacterium sp.]|nr:hypothetical protein [Chloracidobacterium sp.]
MQVRKMPTHITQIEDTEHQRTVLRVEGEMMLDDALLLERIASDIQTDLDTYVTIDLSDLDLLDSESAAVLRRLDSRLGFRIEGIETFLQKAVSAAEKRAGG